MAMSNHFQTKCNVICYIYRIRCFVLFVNEKPLTIQNKNHLLKQHGPQTALTLNRQFKGLLPKRNTDDCQTKKQATNTMPIANGSPLIISQIMFTTKDTPLSLYTTRF